MRKVLLGTLGFAGVVLAHPGHLHAGGNAFSSGFLHPMLGIDHLAVAVAVGLWGAYALGGRAFLPVLTFLSSMFLGSLLGIWGIGFPLAELGVALSVIAMGTLLLKGEVALRWVLPVIALSGLVHGNLHGLEMPGTLSPFAYMMGFLSSTSLLHLSGMLAGSLIRERLTKLAGALMLALGVFLVW